MSVEYGRMGCSYSTTTKGAFDVKVEDLLLMFGGRGRVIMPILLPVGLPPLYPSRGSASNKVSKRRLRLLQIETTNGLCHDGRQEM
jgi:hypothetical protein